MNQHVLLVEDDGRIREIVERGLGARGIVVSSAVDAPSGIELARALDVDLVALSSPSSAHQLSPGSQQLPLIAGYDERRLRPAGLSGQPGV